MFKQVHRVIYAIIVCFTVFCGAVSAQGVRYALSGTVRDASNGESMLGVYVIMTDVNNTSNVQGCVTNQAGYYSISSVSGTYKVTINHLGYKTLEDTVTLDKNLLRRYELEPSAIEGRRW